jgi:hypothetical protein
MIQIDRLLTIDDTGMPKAPSIKQLLDKDVKALYLRDNTPDKMMYIKEVGVIYYLADPKGPCMQEGLSRQEALKRAIENFDLPVNYRPDLLVEKLIKRYHDERVGVVGTAVESLQKAIHNVTLAGNILNELLNNKLSSGLTDEDATTVIDIMDRLNKKITDLPNLIKSLNEAQQQLQLEEETIRVRGGNNAESSMIEEDI